MGPSFAMVKLSLHFKHRCNLFARVADKLFVKLSSPSDDQ